MYVKIRNQIIVNKIKDILESQGRTQTWLAKQIDKSYVVVTNYCNNNKQPSIPLLYKIAEILDVDVCELLEKSKK
nr:helix-turn-helix transcriptional regulator [Flavobacterium taihuense]